MPHPEINAILIHLDELPRPLRTPGMRTVARNAARRLKEEDGEVALGIADELVGSDVDGARMVAFEIAFRQRAARDALDWRWLERLGRTLDGWASVDHFARKLSGPCWQRGQITDQRVLIWAGSEDEWWRRTALVSTIALNERHLGQGDALRTLAICERFVEDRNRLQRKALSWALRELAQRDPAPVEAFLETHAERLAPVIVREVRNKIETGHKLAKPSEAMRQRHAQRFPSSTASP